MKIILLLLTLLLVFAETDFIEEEFPVEVGGRKVGGGGWEPTILNPYRRGGAAWAAG